ncbi:MAG: glycosyltransferase [Isosphaeraceae bacterium]|nr:glycosyltransferase [Isosphaeraceae bacterium]
MKTPRAGAGPSTVLFLHHTSVLGGAERSLLDLVGELDRSRFSPIVVLPGNGPLADSFRALHVPVRYLALRRITRTLTPWALTVTLASVLITTVALTHLMWRARVRAVHANSMSALIFARPAAWLMRRPLIWHVRDFVPGGRFVRISTAGCAYVIAISRAIRAHLQRTLHVRAKIVLIYNGLDVEAAVRAGQPTVGWASFDKNLKVVAMAGQFVPWKKHAVFIEAAALVHRTYPDARFVVAGGDLFADHPGYRAELEALATRLGLGECLTFLGFVDDLPAHLPGVACLVLPSEREPFGRVLIEAMAAGRPVIAISRDGPAEIVRDRVDGFLTEPGSATGIAEAVSRILADPVLADSMGSRGRERVGRKFTLDRTAARFQRVLDAALTAGNARGALTP